MRIETILNAMNFAQARAINSDLDLAHLRDYHNRSERQYRTFRARILRMDAEKDEEIRFQQQLNKVSNGQIDGLKKDVAEKDAEIARLNKLVKWICREDEDD